MSSTSTDRRRAQRHSILLNITMHLGGAVPAIRGRSVDVSRSGIFIMTDARVPEGRRVDLVIVSDHGDPLLTSGTVVHCVREVGIGIRFSKQTESSIRRLQQIIDDFYARKSGDDDDTDMTEPNWMPIGEKHSRVLRKVDRR